MPVPSGSQACSQEVGVGLGPSAQDGIRGPGEAADGFRRCLRPNECPYAQSAPLPLAAPEVWGAALAELLPGDAELAWEIADLLVAEGVLEDDEPSEAELLS
jgi:hypothetical protein